MTEHPEWLVDEIAAAIDPVAIEEGNRFDIAENVLDALFKIGLAAVRCDGVGIAPSEETFWPCWEGPEPCENCTCSHGTRVLVIPLKDPNESDH